MLRPRTVASFLCLVFFTYFLQVCLAVCSPLEAHGDAARQHDSEEATCHTPETTPQNDSEECPRCDLSVSFQVVTQRLQTLTAPSSFSFPLGLLSRPIEFSRSYLDRTGLLHSPVVLLSPRYLILSIFQL